MNTTEGTSATAVGGSALSEGLGPLPEPAFPVLRDGDMQTAPWEVDCYTAEQMRAYAAQEAAAERERWTQESEKMATEADHRFTLDGTTAHWLRELVKRVRGPNVEVTGPRRRDHA